MFVIFLGAPGTGKGTIAKELVEKNGYIQISTGDIMRETIKSGSELGHKLNEIISSGNLVPDELTNEIFVNGLKKYDLSKDKLILDGYPRSLFQAEFLDKYIHENKLNLRKVILFDLPNEVIIDRIGGRLICKQCGQSYHKTTLKPKVDGVCDKCNGPLVSRPDDQPEKVKVRLQEYAVKTEPLINYYKNKNLIATVDATHGVAATYAATMEALK